MTNLSQQSNNQSNYLTYYITWIPYLTSFYHTLDTYLPVIVLIPGWLLNFVLSAVFWRKKFWANSNFGYYYSLYPLFSNMVVSIGIVNFYPTAFNKDLTLVSVQLCQAIWWLRSFFLNLSLLFQTQMSLDRTITVVYPRRFTWLANLGNHIKITLGIFIFSLLYPSIHFARRFIYSADFNNSSKPIECNFPSLSLLTFFSFSFFLIRSICFTVMFLCNLLILVKLIQSKRNLAKSSNQKLTNREYSFALSLLFSNSIQLALNIPFLGVLAMSLYYSFRPGTPLEIIFFFYILYGISNWGKYTFFDLLDA